MKNDKNTTLPEILGIYIRVSTQLQKETGLSSVDQQIRGIEKANELGWEHKIYDDTTYSGTIPIQNRPGGKELIYDITNKIIGGFYVVDLDRLSRDKDYEEPQVLITMFKKSGVRVFTAAGELELSNPTIEFMSRLTGLVSTLENEQKRARINRGVERSVRNGNSSGGDPIPPYGYDKVDKKLVINKTESKWVKKIYELYRKGHGAFYISNYLNDKNVPTKREDKKIKGYLFKNRSKSGKEIRNEFKWLEGVVLGILKNTTYKGVRTIRDIQVECPVIISPDLFDVTQRMFKERMKFKKVSEHEFLLRGLIYCGCEKCTEKKRKFYAHWRHDLKFSTYRCLSNRYKGEFCGNIGISMKYLDDLVWGQILRVEEIFEDYFNSVKSHPSNKKINPEFFETQIEKLKTNIKNATRNLNEDIIKRDEYTELMNDYKKELVHFERDYITYKKKLEVVGDKETMNILKECIKEFKIKEDFSLEEKIKYVRALVDRITIYPKEGDEKQCNITFKLDADSSFRLSKDIFVGYKTLKNRNGFLSEKINVPVINI